MCFIITHSCQFPISPNILAIMKLFLSRDDLEIRKLTVVTKMVAFLTIHMHINSLSVFLTDMHANARTHIAVILSRYIYSSKELRTLIFDRAKYKQTKIDTNVLNC